MELDQAFFDRLGAINWFCRVGQSDLGDPGFPVVYLTERPAVVASLLSEDWADVRTEAQGDLTGYLAKNHSDSYGGYWNRLGQEAQSRLAEGIMPQVDEALRHLGLGANLSTSVLLDLNRIALHAAYYKRFKRIPAFFGRLFLVYSEGHLPCGWQGGIEAWPEGQILVL